MGLDVSKILKGAIVGITLAAGSVPAVTKAEKVGRELETYEKVGRHDSQAIERTIKDY